MKSKNLLIYTLFLSICVSIPHTPAQDTEQTPDTNSTVLTLDGVRLVTTNWLNIPWKYHPGDNPEWASPTYDDTDWESIGTLLPRDELPIDGWQGIGWFRLHLSIQDEQLQNMPLALYVAYQAGASEIYLDGELLYSFGKVGNRENEEEHYWDRNPHVITFSGKTDHLIAVRYSNFSSQKMTPILGFGFILAPLNESIKSRVIMVRQGTTLQMVWTAILVFLMLQHLLLFAFYPRARENFYFALLTGSMGAFVYLIFQFLVLANSATQLQYLPILLIGVYVLIVVSGLLFLYTLFYPKMPKLVWFFLIGWGITLWVGRFDINNYVFHITSPTTFMFNTGLAVLLLLVFTILTFLEMVRVMIVAIFKKKDGAWIFGLGSLSPFLLPFIFGLIVSQTGFNISFELGIIIIFLAPLFSMSVYLARNFSRTRRKLETEELERQLLEVENTRKTEELEEARKLQMSMLPQAAPQLEHLNIAFEMQPATEVGGDYYDYNLTEEGRLIVAIGDATGHGMNAGLVVSAVKSLFKTSSLESGNLDILERISQGIRSMNLNRLYMAMQLTTFNGNNLTITGAGMPPTLIYREDENEVEEILLEGMPLGGMMETERQEVSFELNSGDTILLMSDGLPEMLNRQNEMLDYPRTKELFAEVADKSPKTILRHLFDACTDWSDGEPQADDITLVVVKVK